MLRVLRGFIEGNEVALGIAVCAVVVASVVWLMVRSSRARGGGDI